MGANEGSGVKGLTVSQLILSKLSFSKSCSIILIAFIKKTGFHVVEKKSLLFLMQESPNSEHLNVAMFQ